MEKYETYKDSGIEWIGEIPEHWEVKRLKYIGDSIIGITYSPKEVVQDGGTLVLRSSNIQNGKLSLKDTVYINKDIPEKLETKIGDILICSRNGSRRLIGKNITIDEKTEGETFGAFMTVFRTEQYEFISKYFNSQVFSGQSGLFLTSTINQLTVNTLNNFYTALPPKNEQLKIANYLDNKTAEIDDLISQKKKLLKLYENEKFVIINQAVTKGINPNVALCKSEIEWLEKIPAKWVSTKLKYNTEKIGDGIHSTPQYVDNSDFKFINGNNLKNGTIKFFESTKSVSEDEYDKLKKEIKNGAVLISINGTIGNLALYKNEKVILGKSAAYIECSESLNNEFLFYLLQSHYISKQFNLSYSGSTINNLSLYTLNNLRIALPEYEEQKEIVTFLKNELSQFDLNIKKVKTLIDLLKEYKNSLISDVVTGKLKVT